MSRQQLSTIHTAPEFLYELKVCLTVGHITAREIINCADRMILAEDHVDQIILDLSVALGGEAREIDRIITEHLSGYHAPYAGRVMLATVHHKLAANEITFHQAVNMLFSYRQKTYLEELDRLWLYAEYYEEAREAGIWGNIEYASTEIKALLGVYAGYHLNNYPEWAALHEQVNTKLATWETDAVAIYNRHKEVEPSPLHAFERFISKLWNRVIG